jgi:hypothetical protein
MSYDERTGKIDWRDEQSWAAISICSGLALALIYLFTGHFAGTSGVAVVFVCSLGFYVLSILGRIQNHRGRILTSKTAVPEHVLKYVFPVMGFL